MAKTLLQQGHGLPHAALLPVAADNGNVRGGKGEKGNVRGKEEREGGIEKEGRRDSVKG